MKILVINLERDVEKKKQIVKQLNALHLDFEIVPAILGCALSARDKLRDYNSLSTKLNLGMPLGPSQLGCALSHVKAYRLIAERKIPFALIIEDDVILQLGLQVKLLEIQCNISQDQSMIILLSPAMELGKKNESIKLSNDVNLYEFKNAYYTSSYIITLRAAETLMNKLMPISNVADCWLFISRRKWAEIYSVSPALIYQQQDIYGSSTALDIKTNYPARSVKRIFYYAFKIMGCVKNYICYLLAY